MSDRCTEITELLDSYLSDELLVETNHAVLGHLEGCARCAAELEERRALRRALAAAVEIDADTDTAALEARIVAAIAADARAAAGGAPAPRRRSAWRPWLALAAVLVAAVGLAVGWRLSDGGRAAVGPPAVTALPPAAAGGGVRTASLDGAAFRDTAYNHLYCGIRRPVPHRPTRAEARERLGRYAALLDVVDPGALGYELADAHVCPNGDRRYAHLVLRRDGRTVSIFVTDKTTGDLPPGDRLEDLPGVGEVHVAVVDGFELSGVESTHSFAVVAADAAGAGASADEALARRVLPALASIVRAGGG